MKQTEDRENSRAGTSSRWAGPGSPGRRFLGAAGCGGGEQSGGATEMYFTAPADATGTTEKLISQFNEKNKGKYKVIFREGNSDTGQRFDKLRTEMQAGGEDLDVILGDVIWTAQLAESGWISDLSDRFTESQTAGVPAGLGRGHNLQGQALRYAVVHGYGPPLLPQGSAARRAGSTVLRRPGTSSSR